MGDTPRRGDYIILTPQYVQDHSPNLDDLAPGLYHLCRATQDGDDAYVGLDLLTSEDTQAMCEALAHSAKGPHDVWISSL